MGSAVTSGAGGDAVAAIAYSVVACPYSLSALAVLPAAASTCAPSAKAADTRPTRFGLIFLPGSAARNTGRCAAANVSAGSPSASSASGSRQMSWSPLKVPALLPLPMPTCRYSVLCWASHIWSSHFSPKCASASNVDGAAEPSARSVAKRIASPNAVVWVNFR